MFIAAEAAGGTGNTLIVVLGSVAVSMIGAYAAIRSTTKREPAAPDRPPSWPLPRELVDIYDDAIDRANRLEVEKNMWMQRAFESGWRDES